MSKVKIVAVIPAHMASIRFPGKILHSFFGHPMIEHVRRRALLSSGIEDVYVATCDEVIEKTIRNYGGKVIATGSHHLNGTTRVAEAAELIDCSHIILLQGDEPLLLPSFIDTIANKILANPNGDAWNGTGPIQNQEDIDRHSFVKCAIGENNKILYCFRRGPSHAEFKIQQSYIRKILGVIAFRKGFIKELVNLPASTVEGHEMIEQMRIIENGFSLTSVPFLESLPSVNEPEEADIVIKHVASSKLQQELLAQTFERLEPNAARK